jgi:hypothetical protein
MSLFDRYRGKVSWGRRLGRSALSIGMAITALVLLGVLAYFLLG